MVSLEWFGIGFPSEIVKMQERHLVLFVFVAFLSALLTILCIFLSFM